MATKYDSLFGKPSNVEESIAMIIAYCDYCKTKKCPRNQETQEAILDCAKILQGQFQAIRDRDKLYEDRTDRELIKIMKKSKKPKRKK